MDIEILNKNFPKGKTLVAKVVNIQPFGVFLDIDFPDALGLIKVIDLGLRGVQISSISIGDEMCVKVLGCVDKGRDIHSVYEVIFELY